MAVEFAKNQGLTNWLGVWNSLGIEKDRSGFERKISKQSESCSMTHARAEFCHFRSRIDVEI